ncbi:MAG: oligosaccharide flippase family protein [Lachnospiraceae bacterium]|nr:oligosaccharide flippase family protein [Lachnospiraceae bacterium]
MTKVTTKNTNEKNRQLYLDISLLGIILFYIFRIPLTNMVGNEGNGYFAFAIEGYGVFALFFGNAVYQVTMKMVKIRSRKQIYSTCNHIYVLALIISFTISVLGALVLFFGSSYIKFTDFPILTAVGIKFLTVLLVFTSICGVIRGYFEGIGTNVPTAFSKIIEAFIAGTGALIFTSILGKYGSKIGALLINNQYKSAFSAAGIIVGCICGSIFSLLFLIVVKKIYSYSQNNIKQKNIEEDKFSVKKMILEFTKVFFITILELLFFKSYRLCNILIFTNVYTNNIEGDNKLLSIIGAYHGKILVLNTILILLILSVTGQNIGKIRKCYMKRLSEQSWKFLCEDIKKILILSLPLFGILGFFSKNILMFFYKSASTTETLYLKIGSVGIVLVTLAIYFYKILKKLDFNLSLIFIPIIAFVGQLVVMYLLVNMESVRSISFIISELIFWALVSSMEFFVILRALKPEMFQIESYLKKENV